MFIIVIIILLAVGACSKKVEAVDMSSFSDLGRGNIYLYGEIDLGGFKDYSHREYWRLE